MAKRRRRKLAVMLHADVVGSTNLVQKDEALAHERIRDAFRRFANTARTYGGLPHELRGDALVVEFERASDAVSAALAFQRENAERNATLDGAIRPVLRVGIGMGEVVIADHTVTGAGVVLAQRLEQFAEPGGICIQGAAYETIPRRLPFHYEPLGEREVKGFEEPVRAYRVAQAPGHAIPAAERRLRFKTTSLAVAILGLILLITAALAWLRPWERIEAPASVERMAFPLPDQPSIAVLPFANLSGQPEQEYVSDGLTENIITVLSQVPGMFVIARNSTFVYKGTIVTSQRAAEELGVRYVVQGSFQRESDQIRVHAQLIDALTGRHVWSARFDRTFAGIFALQDDVTQHIVSALEVKLTEEQKARLAWRYTNNVAAYDHFLRGQQHFFRYTEEDNESARALYRQAIDLDPAFSRAYGALAFTYAHAFRRGWYGPSERPLERAAELIEQALAIDSSLPQLHWTQAYIRVYQRQHEQAIEALEKATDLDPNYAQAYGLQGWVYVLTDRPGEAIAIVGKALRLSPYSQAELFLTLGEAYYWTGRYGDAATTLKKAIEYNHNHLHNHIYLAATYVQMGRRQDAEWEAFEVTTLEPQFSLGQWLEVQPHQDPSQLNPLADDLRRAGFPE